ncbi:MAG: FtsB family cell division protein [Mucilaginibacter sp.]|uniref:FtsB family cell division protein n=1 Tax=Mucilaginibacter sp. L3T2-6 TaxID=3062491 RepID=UPI0026747440|nr:septum formation initiator family protein [Mucilaginibacter sp. L3T2-6]MDO3640714.1 septum formation initiator family protein [Mucilaginibacter sp. L3T2-6]MDV6212945.1 septum formation initiator family protein [Mucilaginibacter sp. L3T2-6]
MNSFISNFSGMGFVRLINLFRNKYFLVSAAFVVWMIFFDKNDLFSQYQYHQEVNKLKQERDFYLKETAKVAKDLDELTSNPQQLEKFAREKYLMKKDNEDVFVIVKDKKEGE